MTGYCPHAIIKSANGEKKVVPPSMRREVIVMSLSEALLLFQLIAMIVFGILGYMKK